MDVYKTTVDFWDQRFGKLVNEKREFQLDKPVRFKEVEEGIQWLSKDTASIIDFGCGTGNALMRTIYLGSSSVIGIDISPQAIAMAKYTAKINRIDASTRFEVGGIEQLKTIKTGTLDAALCFNTIDNILPDDALTLIKEIHRILKNDGKFLVKLNGLLPNIVFEDDYYQEISDNFFKEKSGLYFWNLDDEAFTNLISAYFVITKYADVPFPETDYKNRLFYLVKR